MWLEHVVKDDIVLSKDIQAATKEEAEKKFIQEIRRKRNSFPMSRGVVGVRAHLPTEQDVQEVLDDFQSEGLLKIMPKIVATWVFEIVDKDKLEAKGDKIYKELEKISGINAS
jgi:hypothetical protein